MSLFLCCIFMYKLGNIWWKAYIEYICDTSLQHATITIVVNE